MEQSSRIDVHSFTWAAVKYQLEQALERDREALELRNINERDSDFLRGRIALAQEILEMPDRDSEHVSE